MDTIEKRKIHFCKFIEYKIFGIHRISKFNEYAGSKIAVSRMDGTLEVWLYIPTVNDWIQIVRICGYADYSIQSLFWTTSGVLITGDTNGNIIKWNLTNILANTSKTIKNGSIVDMDYCPKRNNCIVASENSVSVYSIETLKCTYSSNLTAKIVSIAYHESGDYFVVSTEDSSIKIFDISTAKCVSIDINPKGISKCIGWCLLFLSNFIIVVSDSRGQIQFWNWLTRACVNIVKCHRKDVLSLTTNDKENIIVSSGVDRTLSVLTNINGSWTFSKIYSRHKHDATSVVIDPKLKYIVSGGNDGSLCHSMLYDTSDDKRRIFGMVSVFSKFQISNNHIAYFGNEQVEVWKLEDDNRPQNSDFHTFKKLVEIKNEINPHIQAGSISSCGRFLTYSTRQTFYIYEIIHNKDFESFSIDKIKIPNSETGYLCAQFSKDSSKLYFVTLDMHIKCLSLKSLILKFDCQIISSTELHYGRCELIIGEQFGILLIYSSTLQIFTIEYGSKCVTNIFNISRAFTCATFDHGSNILYFVSVDGFLFRATFNETVEITKYYIKHILNKKSIQYLSMFYDWHRNRLFLQESFGLYYIEISDINEAYASTESNDKPDVNLNLTKKYIYNLVAGIFKDGSIVLVQKNFRHINNSIYHPIYINKYMSS